MATTLTPRQQIEGVIDLLSDKSRWTQGVLARDANGAAVPPRDPLAVCWCVEGALAKVCSARSDFSFVRFPTWELLLRVFGVAPHIVNDEEGYEAVMQRLRTALEHA